MSPMVLAFGLGIVATLVKSELRLADQLFPGLTLYLLFAIGLKGGMKLDGVPLSSFLIPALAAVALCVSIPFWSYAILRKLGRFDSENAAALAAHYGSVSAVTFSAVLAFLDTREVAHEGFLPALLAIMEIPAILVAIGLSSFARKHASTQPASQELGAVLHKLMTGKGVLLLAGGMMIGFVNGKEGYAQVAPLFDAPFRGALTLFLLELGIMTGRRLGDLKKAGPFLVGFGIVMPLIHGGIGVAVGGWSGLGVGGATVLGTLAASASYIAAPAAVSMALPQANPAYYLTSSLVVTFPFNIVFGIPIYYGLASWMFGS